VRLQAELDDRDQIELPPTLAARTEASFKQIVARETSIFAARKTAFEGQIAAIEDLKRFLSMQVDTLEKQEATGETQIRLINTELGGINQLVKSGLATQPRQLALERTVAQMQGEILRVNTDLLRAKEAISRADLSILELRNKRRTDGSVEIQDVQGRIDQLDKRIRTAERLLADTELDAPRFLADRASARRATPTVRITRNVAGTPTEVNATETTLVQPGDMVKIVAPVLDDELSSTPIARSGVSMGALSN
jgi:multidrug resistance efflux pump